MLDFSGTGKHHRTDRTVPTVPMAPAVGSRDGVMAGSCGIFHELIFYLFILLFTAGQYFYYSTASADH